MDVSTPGAVGAGADNQPGFSLSGLLFNPQGRIGRGPMWLYFIAKWIVTILFVVIGNLLGPNEKRDGGMGIGYLASILLFFYPTIAMGIKRLHDRGYSGWFWLFSFVPLANLWISFEMFFLGGTPGENKFGPPISSAADQKAIIDAFR